MTEIISNLFLLSWSETQELIKEQPNAFVINCTKNLPMVTDNSMRLEVDDDGNKENIDKMFYYYFSVIDVIDDHLNKNNPVFIHCLAGRQRSSSVIAAYLINRKGYSLEEAIKYIKDKKKEAFFPKLNFENALDRFYTLCR